MMFNKILIANRGEIACRVIRTAKKMGIKTVAVYSDVDANAQHVKEADEAIALGGLTARDSYLLIDKVIAAAIATGAKAIHPGYGFLSENEAFAQACFDNDIEFIGPPVEAIRAMGLKSTSKAIMESADVPLTPGYHGQNQDANFLHQEADAIGYPVLIKASAGGGGKGMSLVENSVDFLSSLESCKREALSSFGNDDVLIEKYITRPRHIEVQVFGDKQGNYVHLFERDCSVQRRHQKVLEEAPAPNVPDHYLQQMRQAAINAARAVNYVGAGTVEFIAHQSGEFYFMEMNTRLQVEHPVTEMITGLDLVEWQLRVARGERLPLLQDEIQMNGHALEARIYAEDPYKDFLPAVGKITYLSYPENLEHVRVDSGIVQGDTISSYYDPMIAKLIVKGETRAEALQYMEEALAEFHVLGLRTNITFLHSLVKSPSFSNTQLDTGLIEREHDYLFGQAAKKPVMADVAASMRVIVNQLLVQENNVIKAPWNQVDAWRNNGYVTHHIGLKHDEDEVHSCVKQLTSNQFILDLAGQSYEIELLKKSESQLKIRCNQHQFEVVALQDGQQVAVFMDGQQWLYEYLNPFAAQVEDVGSSGNLQAPMPGTVVKVLVKAGDVVKQGDALLILEAMKMEHTIDAPEDGVIQEVCFDTGDLVSDGDELIIIESSTS